MNELQFFVHNDPDAVRIELAGILREADVETVHQAWQRATFTGALKPVIVDITFVTDADDHARALLEMMRRFDTRIVANRLDSFAIAWPSMTEQIQNSVPKRGWLKSVILFLLKNRPDRFATLPILVAVTELGPGRARHASAEYTTSGDPGVLEEAAW